MKDLTITAIIKVYQYDELNEADRSLMKTAMEATARSYAPYSHFSVGAAALLNNGTIVTRWKGSGKPQRGIRTCGPARNKAGAGCIGRPARSV